jgi:hypothetical protein
MTEGTPGAEIDFQEILNMPAEDAVRPPAKPAGTYRVLIKENEMIKSRDKQTPGVKFTFTDWQPTADVDVDKWQEYLKSPVVDEDTISMQDTFYLTKKAMYRLKDFCLAAGTGDTGPMGKLVGDTLQQRVLVKVSQSVAKDGVTVYNNIDGYAKDE